MPVLAEKDEFQANHDDIRQQAERVPCLLEACHTSEALVLLAHKDEFDPNRYDITQ